MHILYHSIRFLVFVQIIFLVQAEPMQRWTWLYRKNFDEQARITHRNKPFILVNKLSLPHFTQLLFSWNALRPAQGYFVFSVQVRNATTKKWYNWHTMVSWGADEQRSFMDAGQEGTKYCHVRLEVPEHTAADAVRIKIVPQAGATLDMIYSIAVNIAHMAHFPDITTEVQRMRCLPPVFISDIPKYSQMVVPHPHAERMCSPTATAMVLEHLLKKPINPLQLALDVYDIGLDAYGSWPFNTAQAFHEAKAQYYFRVMRFNSCTQLYKYLKESIPVVVSVRGPLEGAFRPYAQGHLLLIVGWDPVTQKILCHDPAAPDEQSVFIGYDATAFLTAWARSKYLAYSAEPAISIQK